VVLRGITIDDLAWSGTKTGTKKQSNEKRMNREPLGFVGFVLRLSGIVGLAGTFLACGSAVPLQSAGPCSPAVVAPAGTFEMHQYYMGFLRRGPAWSAEQTPEVKLIGEGHMAHIRAMGATGKMILAGPFEIEGTPPNAIAGILLFDVEKIEEARVMAADDPAVKAGRFTLEVVPWYGPKGITFPGQERPTSGSSVAPAPVR
jgi:uncharacterized protein YciI